MSDVLIPDAQLKAEGDPAWEKARRGRRRGPLQSLVFRDPQYTPHEPGHAVEALAEVFDLADFPHDGSPYDPDLMTRLEA